jgi:hypothetical protein
MRWYHGTSSTSGLDLGDYLDPQRGSFEPCVWVTSSVLHAREFAYARASLDRAKGTRDSVPVVWMVQIDPLAIVVQADDLRSTDDLADYKSSGYDAVQIEQGERGVPEMAILTRSVAKLVRATR